MATTIVNYRSVEDIQPSTITKTIQLPINLNSPEKTYVSAWTFQYKIHFILDKPCRLAAMSYSITTIRVRKVISLPYENKSTNINIAKEYRKLRQLLLEGAKVTSPDIL